MHTDQLSKTKVTGVDQVDSAQDNIHTLLGDQLGKGGIAQPLGDAVSKEGITRAEEGDSGPLGGYGQDAMDGATSGLKSVGDSVGGGVKGATDGAVDHLGLGGLGGGKK
ncbi:hypothetical protein GQ43DRAFT_444312 [Delitschia confertaspora ATCC 74209]|uniref:Uncharacterized protein n=1 Tax=Delitschia confertaspora ATCC 74209 TaxID=1513339 RepID=A0A9P4MRV1_9PLEO|nr:hypothetical protein GQ43DRAFT_444312 [Delitschia confertaspora ATCC 74209]